MGGWVLVGLYPAVYPVKVNGLYSKARRGVGLSLDGGFCS